MLNVPWEITVVQKGTLGQATRKAAIKVKGQAKRKTSGQQSRMESIKTKAKGRPNWANREPGPVGPLLDMKSNGFETLHQAAGGSRSLIPTRSAPTGTAPKKRGLALPASLGVAGGVTAGVGASVAQHKTAPKKKVSKGLTQTLGKPMKKPGGALKPVQPPKPQVGPKPVTAATGPKPVAAPAGPPPTLRPPSMMPPKPVKPGQPARPR